MRLFLSFREKIIKYYLYVKEKGFFNLLFVNFLNQFLSFGTLLLVAKFLTPEEFGGLKIIQSYTASFLILASFGLNSALLKLCSENRSQEEKSGILRLVIIWSSISTVFSLILLFAFSTLGFITSSQSLTKWLMIYACSIPLQVLTGNFIVYLQANKKIKQMARSQAIVKIQSVILIIGSTWLWGFKGYIISSILAYALGLWPYLQQIGIRFLNSSLNKYPERLFQFAIFSVLANFVTQLGQISDVFILDHFFENRELIGSYALALIFITAASQVTGTVQSITTPYFSEHAENENWMRQHLFVNQTRMALLSIFVAVLVFVAAAILIPLIYGSEYAQTLSFLSILLLKYIVWSSCAVIGSTLLGLGLMHYNFFIAAIVTPISYILAYFFFQSYSIIGVAWSQVISAIIMFVLELGASRIAFSKLYRQKKMP